MNRLIFALLFLVPLTGFSQQYINKTKSQVKQELNAYPAAKDGATNHLIVTDSSLIMQVRGTGVSADHIYTFNKADTCKSEKTIAWSDTVYQNLLNAVLYNKKYEWKQINMNQYISKFSIGMFLEIQTTGTEYSFAIFDTDLDENMYHFLLQNK